MDPLTSLRNLSMRTKLLCLVGGMLVFSNLVTGGLFWSHMKSRNATTLAEYRQDALAHANTILAEQSAIARGVLAACEKRLADSSLEVRQEFARQIFDSLRFGTSGYFFAYDYQGICRILPTKKEWVGTDKSGTVDVNGRKLVLALIDAARRGGDTVHYVFDKPGSPVPQPKLGYGAGFEPWGWMVGTGIYIDDIEEAVSTRQRELSGDLASGLTRVVLATSCILLLLLGIVSFLVGLALRPLAKLGTSLDEVARGGGDLRKRIVVERLDEVGRTAGSFNRFVETLQGMILQIRDRSGSLEASVERVRTASKLAHDGTLSIESSARTMSKAGEESAQDIHRISEATQVVSQSVASVAASLEEMNASLGEVSRTCQEELVVSRKANRLVEVAGTRMDSLSQAAQAIGSVLETIQEIAEQTKLLALNATIEAARAGEAGKGFSVVASEEKELARQTGTATEDIRAKVEDIQSQSKEAARAILDVSSEFRNVESLSQGIGGAVEQQTATVADISRNVASVEAEASSIARVVAGSAKNLESVSRGAQEIHHSLEKLTSQTREMDAAANDLESVSVGMKGDVDLFRT
ncbi:MAG: methyl-accepting chemotaxis protein [Fibrobacteria bacterium]|nr:methyl-accepting chemotaxis protein [Fibrobacteria bacterium]